MALSIEYPDRQALTPPPYLRKLSLWLALAAALSILLSIGASQIILAVGLGVLLLSGLPLRWPPVAWPLALFALWTFVSMAFSPDPAAGIDQIRKMLVGLVMLVVYSAVREVREAKWMALGYMGLGTVAAGRSLYQFWRDVLAARAAHADFYHFYIADRIRGFMSHWMTFSGQELFVLLLFLSFVLFAPDLRRRWWLAVPCGLATGLSLILSDTRSVWIASVVAGAYLLWCWRRWAVLGLPVVLALGLLAAPAAIRERVRSIVDPHGQTDSNSHRLVCWTTGWQMIKAHPIVGVGPDEIKKEKVFFAYLPASISKPLPEGYYGHLHNIYIQYAAERGIPATLLIVLALALAFVKFRRALRGLPPGRSDERFLLQAAIACIIGLMAGGIFEYNLNDTEVLTMFLTILCLGYGAMPAPVQMSQGAR